MDIDKLTLIFPEGHTNFGFSTLLDIDKLTPQKVHGHNVAGFSTLLDIDKLTQPNAGAVERSVLVLCWILINLHC